MLKYTNIIQHSHLNFILPSKLKHPLSEIKLNIRLTKILFNRNRFFVKRKMTFFVTFCLYFKLIVEYFDFIPLQNWYGPTQRTNILKKQQTPYYINI